MIEVTTQDELDKAIAKNESDVEFVAAGTFDIRCGYWLRVHVKAALQWKVTLRAWGSSSVVARGSSRVEARGSSRVVAWGSSRVVAWESSSVVAWGSSRVEARESSSVVAKGYVSLSLWGKVKATLSVSCHAFVHSKEAKVTGGKKTMALIDSPKKWCDYYGVEVKAGVAILFKGVGEGYASHHTPSFKYTPGTKPEAGDWDGGNQECGKGLHFSPHPRMTKEFISDAKHWIACPVKLSEMVIHMNGQYPQKCKAKRVCRPCWEVDEDGNKLNKRGVA